MPESLGAAVEVQVTKADNGATLRAAPDDVLVIGLAETPTTGYRWDVDRVDEGVLELRDSQYFAPVTRAPGAPGERRVIVDVVSTGNGEVRLALRRRWGGGEPVDHFGILVDVQQRG